MREDLDVVRAWLEAASRGDRGIELWHSDATIVNARGWVLDTTYEPPGALDRWWDDVADAFSSFTLQLDRAEHVPDGRVLTRQRLIGTFRASGIQVDQPWYCVVTVREGLIAHATGFLSEPEARRAVEAGTTG